MIKITFLNYLINIYQTLVSGESNDSDKDEEKKWRYLY